MNAYKEQLEIMVELCEKQMKTIKLVTGFTDVHMYPQIVMLRNAKKLLSKED